MSSFSRAMTRSKCRTCGEKLMDTGNFGVRILKAKPIPVKIRKLVKLGKLDDSKKDVLKQTKFGRFLLKRADIVNTVEITCGQCSSSCQITTKRPMRTSVSLQTSTSSTYSSLTSSKKRKRTRNKEVNAGLFIPTPSDIVNKTEEDYPSTYEFKSDTPTASKPITIHAPKSSITKEKEMDNLRRVLFKSKKKIQQGQGLKTSLQHFLSSM